MFKWLLKKDPVQVEFQQAVKKFEAFAKVLVKSHPEAEEFNKIFFDLTEELKETKKKYVELSLKLTKADHEALVVLKDLKEMQNIIEVGSARFGVGAYTYLMMLQKVNITYDTTLGDKTVKDWFRELYTVQANISRKIQSKYGEAFSTLPEPKLARQSTSDVDRPSLS